MILEGGQPRSLLSSAPHVPTVKVSELYFINTKIKLLKRICCVRFLIDSWRAL
jgi:hypothetical protein